MNPTNLNRDRTQMTRIERIYADLKTFSVMVYPCKSALIRFDPRSMAFEFSMEMTR